MTTILIKDNNVNAKQFLEFARTLPYVEIVNEHSIPKYNAAVTETLIKSEIGEDLIECKDANDFFNKLGI
ncbi:MAG: hypothetical protein FWG85_03130 [Bacteroidetes bacterium]|nr:hypothetical protein [Bacteroidota bacterium]